MKIVVPVKQVAALDDECELLGDGSGVDPDGLEWELNEWDTFSLEAALALREAAGEGEVVAITVGDEEAEEGLLSALAKGADRGLRIWDDELAGAAPDALAVARVLAAAVGRESPDLVLCGVQSSDAVNSATGVALAGHLGLAHVAVVKGLERDGSALTVERELEGGLVERLRVALPALLTIQTGINEPRALRDAAGDQAGAPEAARAADARRSRARWRAGRERLRVAPAAAGAAGPGWGGGDARWLDRRGRGADCLAGQGAPRLMAGILVLAEARRGELREVSFELIGAALELKPYAGDRLVVALLDAGAPGHAAALAADGVDEVLTVTVPVAQFEAHVAGRALEALIEQEAPELVIAAHSIDALGFAPAVAASQGLGFASDVTGLGWDDGGPVAMRGAYGDKLIAEYDFPGKSCTLLLLRAGTFAAVDAGPGSAPARAVELELSELARTEHLGYEEVAEGDVDITKADFLLSIGRGIEEQDNIAQFKELAQRFGATLSVSRPLVDAGWMPGARQVGQSGKTVKPRVYLALGISGAVQHLAGMRTAETIIAVNTDPEAPIFSVAHYGAVVDMFELADELEQALG